jgi:hypothetical protein
MIGGLREEEELCTSNTYLSIKLRAQIQSISAIDARDGDMPADASSHGLCHEQ